MFHNGKLPIHRGRSMTNAYLKKITGERFLSAREINGYQQTEAALLCGWKNSTQLSLIEQGKRLVPIDKVLVAADVYSVSVDFLLGMSDEPERDPKSAEQHAMVRHLESLLRGTAENIGAALLVHAKQGGLPMQSIRVLTDDAEAMAAAVARFIELNPKFGDMRGGAPVALALERMATATASAREAIRRFDGLREHAMRVQERKAGLTRPLFDGAN